MDVMISFKNLYSKEVKVHEYKSAKISLDSHFVNIHTEDDVYGYPISCIVSMKIEE